MNARPAFQFYPSDWRKDTALQSCSHAARGVWIDLMCLMHECQPYGHLAINGRPMTPDQIARIIGGSGVEIEGLMTELESAGVFSRDANGIAFCRRMVRDEHTRNVRSAAGGKGGNPELIGGYHSPGFVYAMRRSSDGAVKIGISVDPTKRLYKVRRQRGGESVELLWKGWVLDMGQSEAALHAELSQYRIDSEWFMLDAEGLHRLEVHLKATPKVNPTPSSSSSSSVVKPKTLDQLPLIEDDQPMPAKQNGAQHPATGFDAFWAAYPRKVGKAEAMKAWTRIKGVPTQKILDAVHAQCKTDGWQKDNGQFIPHPSTWLNQGRWDDEVDAPSAPRKLAL